MEQILYEHFLLMLIIIHYINLWLVGQFFILASYIWKTVLKLWMHKINNTTKHIFIEWYDKYNSNWKSISTLNVIFGHILLIVTAVIWPTFDRYGVKHQTIFQCTVFTYIQLSHICTLFHQFKLQYRLQLL